MKPTLVSSKLADNDRREDMSIGRGVQSANEWKIGERFTFAKENERFASLGATSDGNV